MGVADKLICNDSVAKGREGKVHVLYMLHNDPLEGGVSAPGGVEIHVKGLVEELARNQKITPFIWASTGSTLALIEQNDSGEWIRTRLALPNTVSPNTKFDSFYSDRLQEILSVYRIDVVHIQHLSHSPLEIKSFLGDWQGAICFTVHDYFSICPGVNLVDHDGKFCNGGSLEKACPECIKNLTEIQFDVGDWRNVHRSNLERADRVYVPSESAARLIGDILGPKLDREIIVRGHGVAGQKNIPVQSKKISEKLRVGFLGEVAPIKGSKLMLSMIEECPVSEIEWFLVGGIGHWDLQALTQENVYKHGRYKPTELPGILSALQLDVIVFCSICPETFSYTLSESWLNGVPVVVGPLGAPAERVRAQGGGWVVEELTSKAFLDIFRSIRQNPEEYSRVQAEVENIHLTSLAEMASEYANDYIELFNEKWLSDARVTVLQPFWVGAKHDEPQEIMKMTTSSEGLRQKVMQVEEDFLRLIDQNKQTAKYVGELETTLHEKDAALHEKDAVLQERDVTLRQSATTLREQALELQKAQDLLESHQETIQDLSLDRKRIFNSLSWRVTAPLRKVFNLLKKLMRIYRNRRHVLSLRPIHDAEELEGGLYRSTGRSPQFLLQSSLGEVPSAWIRFTGQFQVKGYCRPELQLFDVEGVFLPESRIPLSLDENGNFNELIRILENISEIRVQPFKGLGDFKVSNLVMREVGLVQVMSWHFSTRFKAIVSSPQILMHMGARLFKILKEEGWQGILDGLDRDRKSLGAKTSSNVKYTDYPYWIRKFRVLSDSDIETINQIIGEFADPPVISVIMPVYEAPEKWLRVALDSIIAQLYPHWELCIADDASSSPHIREILEEYMLKDKRIKVEFRQENGHISEASNTAISLASGDYVALLDHDDELTEDALFCVAQEIVENPDLVIIYSDEDKIDEQGEFSIPYFKSDWNPPLFFGQNMLSHLGVFRRDYVEKVGGFRKGYEGSQDWDMGLRIWSHLDRSQVKHIPKVLYHWRAISGSMALDGYAKTYTKDASFRALSDYFNSQNKDVDILPCEITGFWHIKYRLEKFPKVSIIVTIRNSLGMITRCLDSLFAKTVYPHFEIIVIADDDTDQSIIDYVERRSQKDNLRIIKNTKTSSFTSLNNFALGSASGEIICFFADHIEVLQADWLDEMVGHAVQEKVGAVGAKILNLDNTINHVGIVLGVIGTGCKIYENNHKRDGGSGGRTKLAQNLSVVSADCLMVKKDILDTIGGFDEKLVSSYFDIDLCLQIREMGYENVWTPFAEFYSYLNADQGNELGQKNSEKRLNDEDYLNSKWGQMLDVDPYYNPNLTLDKNDSSLAWPPRVN